MSDPNIDTLRTLGPYLFSLEPDTGRRAVLENLFKNQVDLLEQEFKAAKDDKAKEDQYKRSMEAFAKGLTAFTGGVIAAAKGFQAGDNITGTAGVMDTLAAMATMIGAMAGPEGAAVGAVVGAFLSVISMILKCFSDQKPAKSVAAQLEEVIRAYDAEKKIQSLKAAQTGMESFIDAINQGSDARTYSEILASFSFHAGPAMQVILTAAEWIEEPKNQGLDLWGETLTAQCYAYVTFLQSFAIAMRVAKTNRDVTNLVADLVSHHPQQVKFLERIKPAARNRGTVWRVVPGAQTLSASGGWLTVRDAVRSRSSGWRTVSGGGFMRPIAVTTRKMGTNAGAPSPRLPLAMFHVEPEEYSWPENRWDFDMKLMHPFLKNNRTYGLFGRWPAIADGPFTQLESGSGEAGAGWKPLTGCYDIWALPGTKEHEVAVFTAMGDALAGYVQSGTEHAKDEDKHLRHLWSDPVPKGYKVGAVRAVDPRPFLDEDQEALRGVRIVYGACEVQKGMSNINVGGMHGYDHMQLRVLYFAPDKPPVSYNFLCNYRLGDGMRFVGIAVDSRYLWVYDAAGIICATHTAVKHAVEHKADIAWMHYKIPNSVGNYDPKEPSEVPQPVQARGLRELSPCDDGTLTAVFVDREPQFPHIYSLTPRIDHKTGSFVVEGVKEDPDGHLIPTNGWETDLDGDTNHVIKQPIFCWGLIEGLIANLQLTAAPGTIHLRTDNSTALVTMKNSSQDAMTIKVGLAGDHPGDFVVTNKSGNSLGPGALGQISVEFKPKLVEAGKTYLAVLWIESGPSKASVVIYGTQETSQPRPILHG